MGRRWAAALACVLTAGVLAAGCDDEPAPSPPPSPPPAKRTELTFGVFGAQPELQAFQQLVDSYNEQAVTVRVDLETWPDRDAMRRDLDAGKPLPDLFLVTRRDLGHVVEEGWNRPVFSLLEERDISYGDDYSSDALDAFSADDDLQCMPYSVSPMLMYYNTDLVDFDRMRERELPAPSEDDDAWSFDEFEAAARFATRKPRGTRGVSIEPTVGSLAPFLLSGGGSVFDDDTDPTSLDFSSDDNRDTLVQVLELLRDPTLTLTDKQLSRATPEEWFERGKLGMIEGYRDLTPRLRQVPGLHFDVMPMPKIDDYATIGEFSGLCVSPGKLSQKAADFLVYVISQEGYDIVTRTGYILPARVAVARSDAFLQPDQQPAHAQVFNASVSVLQTLPLDVDYNALGEAVGPALEDLLRSPVLDDIDAETEQIDELSRSVLDPDYEPSPTDSPTDVSPSAPETSLPEDPESEVP